MKLNTKLSYDKIYDSTNLVDHIDEEDQLKIVDQCIRGYEIDKESRAEWDQKSEQALKIAKQCIETRNQDGFHSADVKYPLITMSAIQFASRAYPEFIKNDRVVNARIVGQDETGQKEASAKLVTDHMNYQLLIESETWEESFDRLLHVLPIVGVVYKKTYYDPLTAKNCSDLCLPSCIFVNQYAQSLSKARRVSHLIPMYMNDIMEQIRYDLFTDISDKLQKSGTDALSHDYSNFSDLIKIDPQDDDAPRLILEQHTFLDLDGDGYQEPYIVTLDLQTRSLLRIYRRFEQDAVDEVFGKIRKITPTEYFTDYHFIHSPDGTYMSYGYGQLLLPINETVNTAINQVLDAGTLSNRQSGFLGKGFRSKDKVLRVLPGEWKQLDIAGEEIAKNIYPMPVRDPSPVLLNLIQMMISSGQQLAAVTDITTGAVETQNSPATTVLAMLDNSLKPFSSQKKRIYRGLKSELTKWYRLNCLYMDPVQYFNIEDTQLAVSKRDYNLSSKDIIPVADPSVSSDAQRLARAQAIMQSAQLLPATNQLKALRIYFDALQMPAAQINDLVPLDMSEVPPGPETQKTMMEMQKMQHEMKLQEMEQQLRMAEMQIKMSNAQDKKTNIDIKATRTAHDMKMSEIDRALQAQEKATDAAKVEHNALIDQFKAESQRLEAIAKLKQVSQPLDDNEDE